ncbi:hypothetical protein O181_034493 [Austropuccinia psidii MF-1]|uniref:U3 small nucleolar RNA-associated protein 14 homolog A-like n=1 Tax=Austropuccinia psidii MF-1 TaxID=1389203 RepID=A0A9Q3D3K7_9BASI|nr:hypothetical protein [Austropuccinia psidii MF-1]
MVRSARRGRQGTKTSKLKHHHANENLIKSDSKGQFNPKDKDKLIQSNQTFNDFYDYQENTHLKGGRIKGNQVDDERLIGSFNNLNDFIKEETTQHYNLNSSIDTFERSHFNDQKDLNRDDFGIVHIDDDDDEEIDSDKEIGELDQDDLNHKRPISKKNSRVQFSSNQDLDLSDDSQDNDLTSSEDAGCIDASTMLELGAESDNSLSENNQIDQQNDDLSDSSSDSSSILQDDIDLEEIDQDESKLEQLTQIVENLNAITTQKRKGNHQAEAINENQTDGQSKKRKLLPVQSESRPEGEILPGLSSFGFDNSSGQVNLQDLLGNLPSKSATSDLKKSLKPLNSSTNPSQPSSLAAPLETRHQQQVERMAAYQLTKKEMAKWDETSRMARGLSGKSSDGINRFVVQENRLTSADREPNVTRWNMHFKPSNELESQVLNLLQTSQVSSKKLIEEENDLLQSKGLTLEQIREKTAQTKMMRELMFRAERKAKRVAKIKSKAFRRIKKKEKTRSSRINQELDADMEFMQTLDNIDGKGRVDANKEKMELERARERISLKHSSQGKWASKMAGLKGLGSDANAATQERIRREELLKKKISGFNSDQSDETDQESDFDSELDVDDIKTHALNQLSNLDSTKESTLENPPLKGLLGMKFMQTAMAAQAKEADQAEAQLRKQLQEEEGIASDQECNFSGAIKVQGNLGRLIFGPDTCRQVVDQTIDPDKSPSNEDQSSSTAPKTTRTSGSYLRVLEPDLNPISTTQTKSSQDPTPKNQSNPWLASDFSSKEGTASRLKDLVPRASNHKDSPLIVAEKAKLKAQKHKKKQKSEVKLANEDARVEIDMNAFLGEGSQEASVGAQGLKEMEDKNLNSTEGDAIIRLSQTDRSGRTVFEQRELVSQAFADDGVVAQFAEEKSKQVEKDAPQELDMTLPGWGDWVGKGARKSRQPKKFVKKIAGIEPSQRADAKLSHVIISEKKNLKQITKYQTKSLPFPYTSSAQHENKMKQPIGPEFTTRTQHRHLVRPDILLRPGLVIEPVSKPVA